MGLGNRNMALVFKIRRGLSHLTVAAAADYQANPFCFGTVFPALPLAGACCVRVDILGAVDIFGASPGLKGGFDQPLGRLILSPLY